MKSNLLLILAVMVLLVIPSVSASLSIIDSSGNDLTQITKSAVHNTAISLPMFFANNTESTNLTNITIMIGSMTNSSNMISASVDASKTTIFNGTTQNYTISNYNIPQYIAPRVYTIPINVSGVNPNGTSFSDTLNAIITVNESKSLSVSTTDTSVNSNPGRNANTSFTITNNGNTNITNIALTQSSVLKDSDNDSATLAITADRSLSILQPGQTATIFVSASPSSSIRTGSYTTNLIVNSTEGVSATISYTLSISQSFCDRGKIGGYFDININEPDSGDDFYPNDVIPIEVKVRNTNDESRDIVVVANLFDYTDNEFLDQEVSTDGSVSDDSYEYFSLELKVPVDVKDGHSYRVYVKAYEDGEEETQCNEGSVSIDIKKNTHDVVIDKIEVPESSNCDETVNVKVTAANIGKRDESVKIRVYNSELNINEEKIINIDKEEKKTLTLSAHIPKDATRGNHTMRVDAFFYLSNDEYQNSVSKTEQIDIENNCVAEQQNLVLTTEIIDTPYVGEQFVVKLNLFNTGDKTTTYSIVASEYDNWARLDKIDPFTLTLGPSQTASAEVYLTPANVSGSKNFKLKIMYGDKKLEKDINVEVKEKVSAPQAYQGFVTRLSNLSGFDLMTVNVILVVAIILVVMWIIRVRRTY